MKDANFYACVQMHVFVCVYKSLYRLINQQHKLAPKKKNFGSAPGLNILVCSCVQIKFVGGNRNIKEYEIQLIEIQEMEHQLEFFYDHTHYHNIYYKLMKQFFFYLFLYKIEFYFSLTYVYMYVKLPHGNLNSDPYPPHLTNTYTYRMTIAYEC